MRSIAVMHSLQTPTVAASFQEAECQRALEVLRRVAARLPLELATIEHSTASPSRRKNNSNASPQPAWRTSRAAPALEAVLRETLRLHPVAPLVVRNLTSDAVGEDVTLPAGTAVGVWLHAVHRDPRVWDSAYEFKPERWLTDEKDSSEETKQGVKRKGSAFMPFATGPRACVGQHLAWVFMRVTLARLITAYEFQPCDNEDMTPSVGFTVTPASAAKMRVRKL